MVKNYQVGKGLEGLLVNSGLLFQNVKEIAALSFLLFIHSCLIYFLKHAENISNNFLFERSFDDLSVYLVLFVCNTGPTFKQHQSNISFCCEVFVRPIDM